MARGSSWDVVICKCLVVHGLDRRGSGVTSVGVITRKAPRLLGSRGSRPYPLRRVKFSGTETGLWLGGIGDFREVVLARFIVLLVIDELFPVKIPTVDVVLVATVFSVVPHST